MVALLQCSLEIHNSSFYCGVFRVSGGYLVVVAVLQCPPQVHEDPAGLGLRQPLALLDVRQQRAVAVVLHNDTRVPLGLNHLQQQSSSNYFSFYITCNSSVPLR